MQLQNKWPDSLHIRAIARANEQNLHRFFLGIKSKSTQRMQKKYRFFSYCSIKMEQMNNNQ